MRTSLFLAATLALLPALAASQPRSRAMPRDDAAEVGQGTARDAGATTDSEAGTGAASLADVASGPIAFGVVYSSGAKQSGTANWTSSYNASLKRYEISITGQNYYYLNYTTLVTPAGDPRFCRTDSVGGQLLVYCFDQSGTAQPTRFAFTTFKAP